MTVRTGTLSTTPDTTVFYPSTRTRGGGIASVPDTTVFNPSSRCRNASWTRSFSAGSVPDLEVPLSIIPVLQSTATTISVFMRDSSTGVAKPGISPSTFTISTKKSNQSSFSVITPTVTDTGLGWYDLAILGTHVDTYGKMPLSVAAPNAMTRSDIVLDVIAANVFTDSVRAGLTALPNAAAEAAGGLYTRGSGAGQIHQTTNGRIDADVLSAGGTSVADIRDAILDAARSGHVTLGTVGEGIAIATSLLQGNFYMDQTNNTNPNGQTSARIRCFHTGSAAAAATPGGSGEGEFATFVVTTTYSGPSKITDHRVVQQ